MDPATAKVIQVAISQLFKKDQNGDSGLKKLMIVVAICLSVVVFITGIAVEVFLIPENEVINWLLPDSISDARDAIRDGFTRPTIQSGQEGLVALPTYMRQTSSPYGYRILLGNPNHHEGLDFPVPMKTEVGSIEKGVVIDTGYNRSYGTFILIYHQYIYTEEDELGETNEQHGGFYSFYAHLFKAYVFKGQTIEKRQGIALSGGDKKVHMAGNSTGAHLHIEIRTTPRYGSDVDPYDYLLKPISEEEKKKYEFVA